MSYIKYEDIPISIKVKIFVIAVFVTPLVSLFLFANWDNMFSSKSRGDYFLEDRLEKHCSGKIDSIYRQRNNHNILTLRTNNCIFEVDYPWENKFQLGDSISKKVNEPMIKIFRDNKLLEILDYTDVAKTIRN